MDFACLHEDERPREKLLRLGPESLSTAELLAVILRTGRQGEDVMALSHGLLSRMGGVEGLARASVAELMQEKGLKRSRSRRNTPTARRYTRSSSTRATAS